MENNASLTLYSHHDQRDTVKHYHMMPYGSFFVCPFSAKGRTNMELREKFILPEGTTQVMASFRYRGRRSRPSSRGASPNRSTSSQSCPVPLNPSVAMTAKVRGPTLQQSGCHTVDWLIIPQHDFPPTSLPQLINFTLFDHFLVYFSFFLHLVILVVLICESMSLFFCLFCSIYQCSPDSPTYNPQLW